jgi:hypothetical protein
LFYPTVNQPNLVRLLSTGLGMREKWNSMRARNMDCIREGRQCGPDDIRLAEHGGGEEALTSYYNK